MKSRALIFSVLIVCTFVLCACDPIRSMLGLPTSADIEAKGMLIRAQKQALDEQAAALSRAKQYTADSIAAIEALQNVSCAIKKRSQLTTVITVDPPAKYCIIAGAFGTESNADKLCGTLAQDGFKALKLAYRSGMTAVAVNPSDDIVEVAARYSQLRDKNLIPPESWILVNE